MRAPEFWYESSGRQAAPLTRALLMPIAWAYAAIAKWKFSKTIAHRVSIPVICLGNVTMGGTGKTPMAIYIVKTLQETGKNPAIISRGYGGEIAGCLRVNQDEHTAKQVGDEALLLAQHAPVFVGKDRLASASAAIKAGADCLVMDDGLQNPSLHKDLSLLVVDAKVGHGNGRVFPAGPLREPVSQAVARVQGLVLLGNGKTPAKLPADLPVLRGDFQGAGPTPRGALLAFAGIGRPNKFFDALKADGANVVQEMSFADHHRYSSGDLARLEAWAKRDELVLITTAKDHVRLPDDFRKKTLCWPVRLQLQPAADAKLKQMIEDLF